MISIKQGLLFTLIVFLLITCVQEERNTEQSLTQIDKLQLSAKERLLLGPPSDRSVWVTYYSSDSMIVTQRKAADTSTVYIRGSFNADTITSCDNCLLIHERDQYTPSSGYYVNDSLFLLPVVGPSWKVLLFGINFKMKKVMSKRNALPGDYLETYLDAFVYDTQTHRIFCADSFDEYDDTLRLKGLQIHEYAIDSTFFTHRKVKRIKTPSQIRSDSLAMKRTLKSLVQ